MGETLRPKPGDNIDGKYELLGQIGKGGMGVVYEARHTKLGQRVALKFLLPQALEHADAVMRFEREARAAAKLTSPHIVRVADIGKTAAGLPFIVMEFLEGYDLAVALKDKGTLPYPEAVDWIMQACTAMAEAHAGGVVHRDLKPSNLFLAMQPSGPPIVKVMDFGISKMVLEGDELTQTETTLGTPQYMAPEQVLSSKSIDHRADIWSMGVVLYKAITGQYPFRGDGAAQMAVAIATTAPRHVSDADPSIPKGLADAIMRALARHPSDRFQDMASFAQAISAYGTGVIPVTTNNSVSVATAPSSPSLDVLRPSFQDNESATNIVDAATSSPWTQNSEKRAKPQPKPNRWPLVVAGAFAVLGVASFVGVKLVQRPDSLPAQARSTAQVTQTATPPVGSTVSPAQPTAQTPAPVESAAAPVAASAKPAGTPMLVGKQPVAVRSGPAINTAPPKPTSTGTPQKPPPPKDPLHL